MLDRATPTAASESDLDEIMERIRAELRQRREATAANVLAADALPSRYDEFAALPEDALEAYAHDAYRVILGRSPTTEEREQAAWQARGRMSRAVLLERMLALPEAKARGASVPGVTRQAFLDRVARVVRESGVTQRLNPVMRVGRGAKRLAKVAPRLARFEEALAATRQSAVGEQTRRFTSFALQQAEITRVLEARIEALEVGAPGPVLARVLAEAAAERAMPSPEALALLRAAPGPVLAPGASEEARTALAAAGLTLAEGEAAVGAILVPAEASLLALDALLGEAAGRLAADGFLLLPAGDPVAAPGPSTPAGAAGAPLLRRLVAAYGLEYEERDGVRLARRA